MVIIEAATVIHITMTITVTKITIMIMRHHHHQLEEGAGKHSRWVESHYFRMFARLIVAQCSVSYPSFFSFKNKHKCDGFFINTLAANKF